MQIIIPTHPLSRKILVGEYGYLPISLTHHHLLYHQLAAADIYATHDTTRLKALLTRFITLDVSDKLARPILKNAYRCGWQLYQYHKHIMLEYARLHVAAGMGAKEALELFYKNYDIDEDDFSAETAYRYYHRQQEKIKKRSKKSCSKMVKVVLKKSKKVHTILVPPDDEEIEAVAFLIIEDLKHQGKTMYTKFHLQLTCYLYKIAGRRRDYIGDKFNSPVRSINDRIYRVRQQIQRSPKIRNTVERHLPALRPASPCKASDLQGSL